MWSRCMCKSEGVRVLQCCLFVLGLVGCQERPMPANSTSPAQIQIRRATLAEWQKALQEYRGNYIVVDTWATWCLPCREEFPQVVNLHRKYKDQGVVVMSVSIDEPKDEPRALEFLKSQQAEFPNFLLPYDDWTEHWQIKGIPIVLVLDKEGKLLKRFDRDDPDNPFRYEDVDRFLASLVK